MYSERKSIYFVKKNENALNVPQARAIERFSSLGQNEYKNINGFRRVWMIITKRSAARSWQPLFQKHVPC